MNISNKNRNRPVVSVTLSPYHIKALEELVSQANKNSIRNISKSEIIEGLLSRAKVDKEELYKRRLMELESKKSIIQEEIDIVAKELEEYSKKVSIIEEELNGLNI